MSSYIWIEGNQAHTSGANGPITRVVMHATVSPCEVGGARKVARYFQSDSAGGLAHFVVDPSETVQSCQESISCWHAPPNGGSLGVELCDPQAGPSERWYDAPHQQMLSRAAALVADLCARHNVPVEYVNSAGLKAARHGITMHSDVSQAFHKSSHTDPGTGFPMAHFVDLVAKASRPAPKPALKPAPKPVPVVTLEDIVLLIKTKNDPRVFVTNWITRRWVQSSAELHALTAGGVQSNIHVVDDSTMKSIVEVKV